MAQRSLIRANQLDTSGSYHFAQLLIDGYSGADSDDGYLMGLVLKDGYLGGVETLRIDAHNGAINQLGFGQVSFNGNVDAKNGLDVSGADLNVLTNANVTGNVFIQGDLTVEGTTTTIDTEQLLIADPISILNLSGSEALTTWTGFSAHDADGYNRLGWLFNGYWGISTAASAGTDDEPTRALAYLGSGETNGDLSLTSASSGASKIGVNPTAGIVATNVQSALEELSSEITTSGSGTTDIQFTINKDAVAGTDEDSCLIMKGGSGTALVDGYLCSITDDVAGDRLQFSLFRDGVKEDTRLHLGAAGATDNIDAYLVLNAGDGSTAHTASLVLDGNNDILKYTATLHEFIGNVTADNDVTITGDLFANGDTTIGSASSDTLTVTSTITSNLLPTDDTYYLGDNTHRWVDGYFSFFTPVHYTPVGNSNSLQGQLKGIDAALANPIVAPPKGIYLITSSEAFSNALDTSRAVNSGVVVDVSGFSDAQFKEFIFVYWNGQLLWNDDSVAANNAAVQHDVARKTGDLKVVLFAEDVKKGSVIQIVDLT